MTDFATLIMTADASGLKQGEQALDSLAAKGAQAEQRVTKSTAGMSAGVKNVGTSAQRIGPQIQNASYQIGDFAVQIASGQAASMALAQQLPQLLGGFGMLGAVMGAVVAVSAALAPVFMGAAKDAALFEDQLENLRDAVSDYTASVQAAGQPTSDLIEKYGRVAAEAQRALDLMREVDYRKALESAQGMATDLANMFGGLSHSLSDHSGSMTQFQRAVQYIQRDLGLAQGEAVKFANALAEIGRAKTPQEYVSALDNALSTMEQITVSGADQQAMYNQIVAAIGEAQVEMTGIVGATDQASGATWGWVDAMASVRSELGAIASAIASMGGGAIANAAKFTELTALKQGRTIAEAARERQSMQMEAEFSAREAGAGSWVERALLKGERAIAERGLSLDAELDDARSTARERDRASSRKGGGGGRKRGGAGRSERADPYERSVIDIMGQTQAFMAQADAMAKVITAGGNWERALAVIEEEQKLLNAAQKAGTELSEGQKLEIRSMAEAYVDAEDTLERMREATDRGQDAMRGLFGSMLEGTDAATAALIDLLAQIAQVQFASGMMGLLGGTSWGGGLMRGVGGLLTGGAGFGGVDALSGALQGLGLGAVPNFDGGGHTGNGARTGGLDGKGGYLALVHPQETITDHTKGQGGAMSVHVTVGMDESGNLQVRKIAQQEASSAARSVSASVPAQIQQYNANPRRR